MAHLSDIKCHGTVVANILNHKMDKRQFELAKLGLASAASERRWAFARTFCICASFCVCVWLLVQGAESLVAHEEGQITAVAKFVQAFHLGSVFGYVLAAAATGVAYLERRGKQHAIRKLTDLRSRNNPDEPNQSSSGLTADGQSP